MDVESLAKARIHDHQLRWTKQRAALVNILLQARNRYMTVSTVDVLMRQRFKGVSHDTIYRNLKEFKQLDLVEFTHGAHGLAVKLTCSPDVGHHHHFVCQHCGRVQEINMPKAQLDFYAQQLPGAKITGHVFQLYGLCAQCAAKMNKS